GRDGLFIRLDPQDFAACPADSIDFAVMEQTQAAVVSPFDGGWADLGSWSELWRLGATSEADNVTKGEVLLVDSSGCLVFAEDRPVAAMELRDLIVVSSKAGVIVLPRHRAQDVKTVVEQLKARSALASAEGC
ncbi:MAG: mannose-1-phosphate guanylyltransferase/mannose-6-phosphate isomerase, partial [Proteobacteria bacterium]|nr:mannose-1-phosphate guanylyltransferase/mannose-6-phosphate isomerase [Pseudomonadota bacterium]